MSTRELVQPEDQALLDELELALLDLELEPPASGLAALHDTLDAIFPIVELPPGEPTCTDATVHRLSQPKVLLAVAACVVALGIGLAWNGSQLSGPPAPSLSRISFATTALRRDLPKTGSPAASARTEDDLTALADLLAQVPATQRVQVAAASGSTRLIPEACSRLAHVPTAQLPPACHATPGNPDFATSGHRAGATSGGPSGTTAVTGARSLGGFHGGYAGSPSGGGTDGRGGTSSHGPATLGHPSSGSTTPSGSFSQLGRNDIPTANGGNPEPAPRSNASAGSGSGMASPQSGHGAGGSTPGGHEQQSSGGTSGPPPSQRDSHAIESGPGVGAGSTGPRSL